MYWLLHFFHLLVLLVVSRCMYIFTRVVTQNLIYWSTLQMMLSGALLFRQYVYLMTQTNTLWQTLVEVQQLLELLLKLNDYLLFLQNLHSRLPKLIVPLHLLLSCLYAGWSSKWGGGNQVYSSR